MDAHFPSMEDVVYGINTQIYAVHTGLQSTGLTELDLSDSSTWLTAVLLARDRVPFGTTASDPISRVLTIH